MAGDYFRSAYSRSVVEKSMLDVRFMLDFIFASTLRIITHWSESIFANILPILPKLFESKIT